MSNAEFCAGCPFSGDYVDEVTVAQGSLQAPKGTRSSERLALRFTDSDGLQTNPCTVSIREYTPDQLTDEVRKIVVARAVIRVMRCSGPGTSTEGRPRCRAINETVLSKLLQMVTSEEEGTPTGTESGISERA